MSLSSNVTNRRDTQNNTTPTQHRATEAVRCLAQRTNTPRTNSSYIRNAGITQPIACLPRGKKPQHLSIFTRRANLPHHFLQPKSSQKWLLQELDTPLQQVMSLVLPQFCQKNNSLSKHNACTSHSSLTVVQLAAMSALQGGSSYVASVSVDFFHISQWDVSRPAVSDPLGWGPRAGKGGGRRRP